MRGEEVDGVVTPVVDQTHVDQARLRDDCLNRQQLNRGNTNLFQVSDRGLMPKCRIGAAQLIWQRRVAAGQPSRVCFVDDRVS